LSKETEEKEEEEEGETVLVKASKKDVIERK